ncbi:hypothetical protein D3C84_1005240 [compost metagenome]
MMINGYFKNRIAYDIEETGTTKFEIATTDVTMIIMLLTRPACWAACPRMRPPTVVAVEPIYRGSLALASIRASIRKSMRNTSMNDG